MSNLKKPPCQIMPHCAPVRCGRPSFFYSFTRQTVHPWPPSHLQWYICLKKICKKFNSIGKNMWTIRQRLVKTGRVHKASLMLINTRIRCTRTFFAVDRVVQMEFGLLRRDRTTGEFWRNFALEKSSYTVVMEAEKSLKITLQPQV